MLSLRRSAFCSATIATVWERCCWPCCIRWCWVWSESRRLNCCNRTVSSVFDRAALLSGSLHDAPLSVASGPAGPVATAQAARPVLEPPAGSPPHTGAFDFRLGLDGLGALRAARERSRRLQPEQAGASFLLPTAVFRSPDPRLLARRVAARRCGHAARRAGMRTGLLPQNPAEGPTRDFARRQRVFRSQADRLGGGARRRLCDRGP